MKGHFNCKQYLWYLWGIIFIIKKTEKHSVYHPLRCSTGTNWTQKCNCSRHDHKHTLASVRMQKHSTRPLSFVHTFKKKHPFVNPTRLEKRLKCLPTRTIDSIRHHQIIISAKLIANIPDRNSKTRTALWLPASASQQLKNANSRFNHEAINAHVSKEQGMATTFGENVAGSSNLADKSLTSMAPVVVW